MEKLKLDEDVIARLFAWPRFIVGASLIAAFALAIFISSIAVGYGLKMVNVIQLHLRAILVSRKFRN